MIDVTKVGVLAAGVLMAGGLAACGSEPPATSTASPDPLASACTDVHTAIGESTARFSSAMGTAVAAGERGDAAAQKAAMGDLRNAFAGWSAVLRDRAGRAPDQRLAEVLTEYAGAVDATIAKVRTPDDLAKLTALTEAEVSGPAGRLDDLCP